MQKHSFKSRSENVAQPVNVICSRKKPYTVFSNVLTDNVKIHVVVYMKKDGNFIRAVLKQYWNLSGKVT